MCTRPPLHIPGNCPPTLEDAERMAAAAAGQSYGQWLAERVAPAPVCEHPPDRVFYEAETHHCEGCGASKPNYTSLRRMSGDMSLPFGMQEPEWRVPPPGGYIPHRLGCKCGRPECP